MRAVLPGRPPAKLQAFSTALWDGLRVVVRPAPCLQLVCVLLQLAFLLRCLIRVHLLINAPAHQQQAYISGHALVILGGPQTLLQTVYVDDTKNLEAVAFDEASGKIAVCGGPDIFVYQPYGIQGETLKVRILQIGPPALSAGRKSSYTGKRQLY